MGVRQGGPHRSGTDGRSPRYFWGGEMTVSPDEDMGLRPMAAQIGQEPDQDHGVLRTRGALARAETGGD